MLRLICALPPDPSKKAGRRLVGPGGRNLDLAATLNVGSGRDWMAGCFTRFDDASVQRAATLTLVPVRPRAAMAR